MQIVKGDIILRIIISFLVPVLMLYSGFLFLSFSEFGFLSILQCAIYLMLAYLLFFIRFEKVRVKKVISFGAILNFLLFVFLIFLVLFLLILLKSEG